MFGSQTQLRHLPFFEELAKLDESSPIWDEMTGGLLVLRLVDSWLEEGPSVVASDAWGASAVRDAIEKIDESRPSRRILVAILDAMTDSRVSDPHLIVPRLMAYAQQLEYETRLALAADVYASVGENATSPEDSDLAIAAHQGLGRSTRGLGDFEGAEKTFERTIEMASRAGNLPARLRAEIGRAVTVMMRGNLPRAESLLGDVVSEAERTGLKTVRSMALHDYAVIAAARGDFETAIQRAYAALPDAESAHARDRILANLAAAFADLGIRTTARDAYLILSTTAQEQYTRWFATLNLLEIAALDGSEPVFEAYRRELAAADLPSSLVVHFRYRTGQGYRRLGDFESARPWLRDALQTAETIGANQLVFEIEAELAACDREPTREPVTQPPEFVSEGVAVAARAVREIREAIAR